MDDLNKSRCTLISIHAPLTGSDGVTDYVAFCTRISIHAPLTGSDPRQQISVNIYIKFQSTLPSQGATVFPAVLMVGLYNFNPRSPHRERPENISSIYESLLFQSTLPSQGATVRYIGNGLGVEHFNPRSPHRERQNVMSFYNLDSIFQSTLPSQGATH